MALGTTLLALALGYAGYESNIVQNEAVLSVMKHGFSTIPGIFWVLTAIVLFFYKLNRRSYNRIVNVIKYRILRRERHSRKYDVVALGELLVDFYQEKTVDKNTSVYESNAGGAPCNVLAMLAKMNKRTAFIGKIGDDFLGNALKKTMAQIGISNEGLVMDKRYNTTLAFVQIEPDGERDFVFYRNNSADMNLMESDVKIDLLSRTRIFHFGSISLTHKHCRNATKKAVRAAKSSKCLISFDPNYRHYVWRKEEEARKQMLYGCSVCDVLKVEESELKFITQCATVADGVKFLQNKFDIRLILVTFGAKGSQAFTATQSAQQNAFLTDSIDTTGTGDTFLGCCLAYLLDNGLELSNEQLARMLQFANAAASLGAKKMGAIKSMPQKEEVELFLNSLK
jgi:fructokinase